MLRAILALLRRPLAVRSQEMATIEERIIAAEARLNVEDTPYRDRLRDRKARA